MSGNVIVSSSGQVQKQYRSRIAHDREFTFLTILAGTGLVPEILQRDGNTLTLVSVKGPTLLEFMEKVWAGALPLAVGRRLLQELVGWLCATHQKLFAQTGRTFALEDPHLRNFMWNQSSGMLVGLDFEHWHDGTAEETPAMLLAFLSGYRGAQSATAKTLYDEFRAQLLTQLAIEPSALSRLEAQCRRLIALRRSTAEQRWNTTAVILAGGRSVRMGRPKQNLDANGHTFLERMLDTLDSFDHLVVSVGRMPCPDLPVPAWEDLYPDCGPIGGLLTALSRAKTPLVFLTACDTPDLSEALILHLYEALLPEDDCLVPVIHGRIHPLTGIYRTRLVSEAERLVQTGTYRMRALLDAVNTHYLPLGVAFSAQLSNINTPLEYDAWQARHTT